nr:hypothetical protein [Tanacetum cinerariifolium]
MVVLELDRNPSRRTSALRPPAGLAAAADELSPTSYPGPRAIPSLFRGADKGGGIPDEGASDLVGESMKGGGLRGGAGDNTGEGGDSIGGSGGKGIRGGGEDKGDNGDDGGVDIASSLTTSESD